MDRRRGTHSRLCSVMRIAHASHPGKGRQGIDLPELLRRMAALENFMRLPHSKSHIRRFAVLRGRKSSLAGSDPQGPEFPVDRADLREASQGIRVSLAGCGNQLSLRRILSCWSPPGWQLFSDSSPWPNAYAALRRWHVAPWR